MEGETFQALLEVLHADKETAAQEYHRLHLRLVRFFALHPIADPHALADEALDRLARRIEASPNKVDSPSAFLFGIARHLLQEDERRRARESRAVNEWASRIVQPSEADEEVLVRVENCLGRMKKEQRELLLAYYRSSGREKIEHHRELAAQLGLTLNALRNRLMRARRELDACVRRSDSDVSRDRSTKR